MIGKTKSLAIFILLSIILMLVAAVGVGASGRRVLKNITPEEAYELVQKRGTSPDFVILDVRTPDEYESGYIESALNFDFYSETFKTELDKLNKDNTYLVYCRSGRRSSRTLDIMRELRFQKVYDIEGGITKWRHENYPIVE